MAAAVGLDRLLVVIPQEVQEQEDRGAMGDVEKELVGHTQRAVAAGQVQLVRMLQQTSTRGEMEALVLQARLPALALLALAVVVVKAPSRVVLAVLVAAGMAQLVLRTLEKQRVQQILAVAAVAAVTTAPAVPQAARG
ncbi:hypothetical protein HY573_00340 [Candidatus Parcubacteria bacterium]|nr:hypothetical protein [Candidatus Parcubacteria bacterium]